ncbi:MAG: hypothetical protein ABH877_01665, partial [bacterium]
MNAFQSRRWCMMMLVGLALLVIFGLVVKVLAHGPPEPGYYVLLCFQTQVPLADETKAAVAWADMLARLKSKDWPMQMNKWTP